MMKKFKIISLKTSTNIQNNKGHLDMTLPQGGGEIKTSTQVENCKTNVIEELSNIILFAITRV